MGNTQENAAQGKGPEAAQALGNAGVEYTTELRRVEPLRPEMRVHFLVGKPTSKGATAAKVITDQGQNVQDHNIRFRVRMRDVQADSALAALEMLLTVTQAPNYWVQLGSLAAPVGDDGWTKRLRRIGVKSPNCTGKGASAGLTDECDTRLLVFDLDDVVIPEFDYLNPVPAVQWFLKSARLEGVSCVWQLTSSQKPNNTKARLRVWMVTDQAESPRDLKNYMKSLPLHLGVDPCMYDGNRAIYCAAPLVVAHDDHNTVADDFIPVRSGLLRGKSDTAQIVIPDPEMMDVVTRARREAGAGVGGMDIEYLPPGEECSLIVDADVHGGLGNATWWLVANNPGITYDEVVDTIKQKAADNLAREGRLQQAFDSGEVKRLYDGAVKLVSVSQSQVIEASPEFSVDEMCLDEATDALTQSVMAFYRDGGQVLLSGAAGLGKTREVLRQIPSPPTVEWEEGGWFFGHREAGSLTLPGPQVDIYVPTHELADEMEERCEAEGRRAVVIKGRTAVPYEGADPLCQRHELVKLMRKQGAQGEGATLCLSQYDGQCPYWGECEYIAQFKSIDVFTQVVIRTHNSLGIGTSFVEAMLMSDRDAERVIIDESPLGALVDAENWNVKELRRYPHPFMRKLVKAVMDEKNLVQQFAGSVDELDALLDYHDEASRCGASPNQSDKEIHRAIDRFSHPSLPVVALRRLKQAIKRKEEVFNGMWLGETGKIHTAGLDFSTRDINNAIVLDATLDDALFRYVMPDAKTVNIPVARRANVYQVWNRSYAHSQLIRRGKNGQAAIPEVVAGVQRFIRSLESQGKSVGLVAPKMLEEAVAHDPSAHFNGLRGIDRLKDLAAGVIVGRIMPPEFDVQRIARALFPFEKMSFPGDYVQRPAGYRMASGENKGMMEWYHPDPLINRVLRQSREAESSQAVDRLRLIHREIPADIFILSRLPLNVTVDKLIKDPLSKPKMLEAMDRADWVLPLVPEWLADEMPDLFKNETAAKDWAKQNVFRQDRGAYRNVSPAGSAGGAQMSSEDRLSHFNFINSMFEAGQPGQPDRRNTGRQVPPVESAAKSSTAPEFFDVKPDCGVRASGGQEQKVTGGTCLLSIYRQVPPVDSDVQARKSARSSKQFPFDWSTASVIARPAARLMDCDLIPGARLLRFRLRDRHKRSSRKFLPAALTTLRKNSDVVRILNAHFPHDTVIELIEY